MENKAIREYAKKKKVWIWQIADAMGVSEATISRRLRHELSDYEKKKFTSAIDSIADGRGDEN